MKCHRWSNFSMKGVSITLLGKIFLNLHNLLLKPRYFSNLSSIRFQTCLSFRRYAFGHAKWRLSKFFRGVNPLIMRGFVCLSLRFWQLQFLAKLMSLEYFVKQQKFHDFGKQLVFYLIKMWMDHFWRQSRWIDLELWQPESETQTNLAFCLLYDKKAPKRNPLLKLGKVICLLPLFINLKFKICVRILSFLKIVKFLFCFGIWVNSNLHNLLTLNSLL